VPDAMPLHVKVAATVRQYQQLRAAAASQGHSVEEMLNEDLNKDVQNILGAPAPAHPRNPE